MDQRFNQIFNTKRPDNEVFRVVFYPDRIYHAAYLNATVSQRYRYNVTEVRNKHDITLIKAEVFQDGQFLANVLRIEYIGNRLNETTREKGRVLQDCVQATLSAVTKEGANITAPLNLHYDSWVRAYQCEIW